MVNPRNTLHMFFCYVILAWFLTKHTHYHAGVKVRVYCQVGKAYQGKFALHVAVKTLGLYKEYVLIFLCAAISLCISEFSSCFPIVLTCLLIRCFLFYFLKF